MAGGLQVCPPAYAKVLLETEIWYTERVTGSDGRHRHGGHSC